jgi:hypothetical protein
MRTKHQNNSYSLIKKLKINEKLEECREGQQPMTEEQ